jgi:REP element-mobilizing transposase RayT
MASAMIFLLNVVMPDHVDILVKPFDKHPLSDLVRSWKSYTAYQVQRKHGRYGKIWQEDYFDRIIRNENEFLGKAKYILNNPLKISPQNEEYPWVWVNTDIV